MFNIKFCGKYNNEKQLMKKELPNSAIQFVEGKTLKEPFVKGFLIILPILLSIIVVSILILKKVKENGLTFNKMEFAIGFMIALILIQIFTYIHEIIHAIFYSRNVEKQIWKYHKQFAYFVFCDELVSKPRFIILNLAPSIILGVIPYLIWFLTSGHLSISISICIIIFSFVMILISVGDYFNVYNAIRQVPKKAKVFNYGLHSYWLK